MKYFLAFAFFMGIFFNSIASADLVLSAPPREHSGAGSKTYGALANKLSAVLGERVVYEQPASWAAYSDKMRHDKYDIIFDGPHFVSWRIKRIGHQPVARLPGNLVFYIVTKEGNKTLTDVPSLRTSKVCAFASPNMTAAVLLERFKNEIVVPTVVDVRGNMGDIMSALEEGKCEAAVLRDHYYNKKLSDEQRAGLRVLHKTREYPNQGISVSSRMTPEQISKIAAVLKEGDASIKPITDRFAKGTKQFMQSNTAEYSGVSDLLEGVVWGW